MKFCDVCHSYMKKTKEGFLCRKCGSVVQIDSETPTIRRMTAEDQPSIYVANAHSDEGMEVSRTCPKCGNNKAIHRLSQISGEHAGVRRERTVDHFRCTKCHHSWGSSS